MSRNPLLALFVLCFCVFASAATRSSGAERKLERYMHEAAMTLDAERIAALERIWDSKRRRLALAYYLRAGNKLRERWSWTEERIASYEKSEEFEDVLAEIQKISERFTADNPGYRLFINTRVRSLEDQVGRWLRNGSVASAAEQLHRAALKELADDRYGIDPRPDGVNAFRKFLNAWRAPAPPTLAAPGMSLHGSGRAFDFQIQSDRGVTVAGTDSSTVASVWDAKGWTQKLKAAVQAGSDRFVGPLEAPREPWHYEYRPRMKGT